MQQRTPPSGPPQRVVKVKPRFFIILMLLALIVVLVFILLRSTGGGADYAIVENFEQGTHYSGEVVVVRDEQVVAAETFTRIDFVAEEGAMVYRGNVICRVYSSGYNQTEINTLEKYRTEIKQYHRDQLESSIVDTQLDTINANIAQLANGVRQIVQGEGVGSLNNLQDQLTAALNQRKTYLQQKYPDEQSLATLYDRETSQLRKIESWTSTFTAPGESLVSFYTDGFEEAINIEGFDDITPAMTRQVMAGVRPEGDAVSRGRKSIYRLVQPNTWGVLLLTRNSEWTPAVGQVYNLQLEGYSDYIVQATVRSSVRAGSDLMVRLDVTGDVLPVLNIRSTRAVIGETLNGLRVPVNALYVQGEQVGVVTGDGGYEAFVPTQVVSRNEQYAVVVPIYENTLLAGQRVKLF